jgi:chromosome segregation ATPase
MSKQNFDTVEEAAKHIKELEASHKSALDEQKAKNKAALDDMKKKGDEALGAKDDQVESLQDQVKELTEKLSAAEKDRDEAATNLTKALSEVSDLSQQLDLRERHGGAAIVRIGKKDYSLNGKRFNVPGYGTLTVEELSKNKEALQLLVSKKSGLVTEVAADS